MPARAVLEGVLTLQARCRPFLLLLRSPVVSLINAGCMRNATGSTNDPVVLGARLPPLPVPAAASVHTHRSPPPSACRPAKSCCSWPAAWQWLATARACAPPQSLRWRRRCPRPSSHWCGLGDGGACRLQLLPQARLVPYLNSLCFKHQTSSQVPQHLPAGGGQGGGACGSGSSARAGAGAAGRVYGPHLLAAWRMHWLAPRRQQVRALSGQPAWGGAAARGWLVSLYSHCRRPSPRLPAPRPQALPAAAHPLRRLLPAACRGRLWRRHLPVPAGQRWHSRAAGRTGGSWQSGERRRRSKFHASCL